MGRVLAATLSLLVALPLSISLHAKGATSKITISGSALSEPISITDDAVLSKFQVRAGPGVLHGSGPIFREDGAIVERRGLIFEETEGFIIDWSSGVVAEHPNGLPHYEIAFYVSASDQPVYVVYYESDSSTGNGYVYLPGKGDDLYPVNGTAMFHGHGFEGHWLRASGEWQNIAAPLVARVAR